MSTSTFRRDRFFWLTALQTGVFGIFMGGFGPALPLLREEQGTSAAVAGLHGTALGFASIVAGILNARIVHKFGRANSVWVGLIIFNCGAIGFVLFPQAWQTITAIFFGGVGLSITINNTFVKLSIKFPNDSARAISQANGVNSAFMLIGNFIIGLIASTTFSWKIGLLLCLPFTFFLYLFLGKTETTDYIPDSQGRQRGSLPSRYWISWIGMTFCIASEFAVGFWAAALLKERTSITSALATTLVLAYPTGMMLGRWFGTFLFPKFSIDKRLCFFISVQGSSFLIFWTSEFLFLSFIALLIVGFGTSMQFALSTLRLLNFGHEKTDLAMGKSSLGAGLAIAISPLFLGFLSDQIGIKNAFLFVPILVVCAFVIVLLVPSAIHESEKV